MTLTLRSDIVSNERIDEMMKNQFSLNQKKKLLLNVQTILNIDENARKHLNCYVKNTLTSLKNLLHKKIRIRFVEKSNLKKIFIKIKNRLFTIEKHTIN